MTDESAVPAILDDPITEAKAAIDRGVAALKREDYDDAQHQFSWAESNIVAAHQIIRLRNNVTRRRQ